MKQSKIDKFIRRYKGQGNDYSYKYLDEGIFWLCKKYSNHNNTEQVYAKVTMINQVYRANLQMSKSGAEWKLAEYLVKKNFDNIIAPLKSIKNFDEKTIDTIIRIHGMFVRLTRRALKKYANSFCSKYLSFHFPKIIPIFDKRAYTTAWKLVGSELEDISFERLINADYAYYCASILKLMEYLKNKGIKKPNLKIIDVLLYDVMFDEI
jgi:hypothetical protein